ncbi:MAG TPA: cohesin domain-containing protein, partial [Candidatus Hydrogenedentes bacterium]|nr:cohesin domain-containing protein [Candidatus Hydrogenedentota bacterium]
ECIATNAFTYRDNQGVLLTLPSVIGDYGTMVDVPLVVSDVQGLVAASGITIDYDPAVLRVNNVDKGGLIYNWQFVVNTNTSGKITLLIMSLTIWPVK